MPFKTQANSRIQLCEGCGRACGRLNAISAVSGGEPAAYMGLLRIGYLWLLRK